MLQKNSRAKSLLSTKGISKAFGGQMVIDDIDLNISEGEVVLLQGPNGSGKTTLLNILTGNLKPDSGVVRLSTNGNKFKYEFSGRRQFIDHFRNSFTPEKFSKNGVGRTWQEVRLFSSMNLLDNVAIAKPKQTGEALFDIFFRRSKVALEKERIETESRRVLRQLGIEDRSASSADMISLGQSRRVSIARAIEAGARILFLDEPLACLDEPGIGSVMALLRNLANDSSVSIVIIEHVLNIPRVLDIVDTVWNLKAGRLTTEPAKDTQMKHFNTEDNIFKCLRKSFSCPDLRAEVTPLPRGGTLRTFSIPSIGGRESSLEIRNLIIHRGKRSVINSSSRDENNEGLSFTLNRGQLGIIQAPNGWGKTTLLEAIAGIIPTVSGEIRLKGIYLNKMAADKRVRNGLRFLQARDNTFPGLTVKEAFALRGISSLPTNLRRWAGLTIGQLSGGEKQRVALECVLSIRQASVIMLDEPLSAFDDEAIGSFISRIACELAKAAILICLPSLGSNASN